MAEKDVKKRESSQSSSNGSTSWEESGDNIFRRRTSSVNEAKHLPRLKIPKEEVKEENNEVFEDEIEEEGKELFGEFVAENIKKEGLPVPETLSTVTHGSASARSPVSPPSARWNKNLDWAWTGKKLRRIAKKFEQSKERKLVKKKAEEVYRNSRQVSYSGFQDLLTEFFLEGITLERIVILFLFCSDLAIFALKNSDLSIFEKLITWSIKYITTKICNWVRKQGGWDVVVWGALRYVPYVALAAAVMGTAGVFLYYWLNGRAEVKK